MIKITKAEMEHLQNKGVRFGDGGMSHTVARHRRTYYLTESRRNLKMLNEYRKGHIVKSYGK